nr:hypothetical protein [uncultured Rhodopila sp.]
MPSLRDELEGRAAAAEAVGDPGATFLRSLVIRCDIEQKRDDRVEEMLATAERIAGGAIAAKAAERLPAAIDRLVRLRLGLYVLGAAIVFAGAGTGFYALAYRSGKAAGEARAVHVEAAISKALTRSDAEVWLVLMRNNDAIASTPRTCAEVDGRMACQMELWSGPAPPPPDPAQQTQHAAATSWPAKPSNKGKQ